MNSKIARIVGCALLASSLGIGMAGAQTTASSSSTVRPSIPKPFPPPSRPKPPFDIPIVLYGIMPPNDKDTFVVAPLVPSVYFAAGKVGTSPVFGGFTPSPKADLVERGGYDR